MFDYIIKVFSGEFMIYSSYKIQKDNVIDLFEGYKRIRGKNNDGINLKFLESRVNSLKKGKYTLVVAGEVKAGKSTFINALLGVELLPSDVLQTTSAIVEILKADEPYLKIKYASGNENTFNHKEMTKNGESFQEKIKEVCSIRDEYRDLPTTLLNNEIIQQDKLKLDEALLKYLEDKSQLDLTNKVELIKKYIENHPKDKIPVEIQVGFPSKWVFDELRLVDSPGVNAIGGIQDISFNYFLEANAIIFVHRIDPIESKSFREFVISVIPERSKETLFLVLTHIGLKTDNDIIRLHNEAKRLYKDYIPEDRILVVDSLLKIIYNDIQNGLSIEQIEQSSTYKADILPKFLRKAEKEKRDLKEILLEYSQFDKMFSVIDKFSLQAPRLQLFEIIEKIKEGYKNLEEKINDEVNRKKVKKKSPQLFAEEIERIKKALSKYENLIKKTKEQLEQSFTGRHSNWIAKIKELKTKYSELIESGNSRVIIRKHFFDALNEIYKIAKNFSKSITEELNSRLQESGKKFQEEHKITIPKVDLDAIEYKANKNAYIEKDIIVTRKRDFDFWDWITLGIARLFRENEKKVKRKKKEFDKNIYLRELKSNLINEFSKIVNNLHNKSREVLQNYLSDFEI
ncbi:MAG: dynamin family protein, partial [Ignavibacterium sp.]|nr:dynamin family protein [Ignavibacterium sp.]MDW8375905.1 dynamin family protein [Ignavibacteriales bacterium]